MYRVDVGARVVGVAYHDGATNGYGRVPGGGVIGAGCSGGWQMTGMVR